MSRPKTAQAQRPEPRQESSIPIPRTKSIPSLRRPIPTVSQPLPLPLGISRTQSQFPIPIPVLRNGLSRKPSIPLRSGLPHVQTQVNRKVSTTRLKSPVPLLSTSRVRGREKKSLPTRSGLNLNVNPNSNPNPTKAKRNAQEPLSPSINSVPVVNRLNRKASIPIIPRATYITPPGIKPGKGAERPKEKKKRDEDIFQGGLSSIKATNEVEVERGGIQKMMMRGTKVERPDYLGLGMELQDMSIDLNGTPSPTKPTGERINKPPIPSMNNRLNQDQRDFKPRSQLARSPFKNDSHQFEFNSPIRLPRPTQPDATPLFPRWPKDNGYIVDVDEMSMLGEESFRFTGDSIEIPTPTPTLPFTSTSKAAAVNGTDKNKVIENQEEGGNQEREREDELRMIEGRLATISLERDDALLQYQKGMVENKEIRYREVRRGIELELERCGEYRGWLDGLRDLLAARGGMD